MAITIEGIKVINMAIERGEGGLLKLSGNYELISNTGVTLAKQQFNSYNSIQVNQSPGTTKTLNDLLASLTADLNQTLGLI